MLLWQLTNADGFKAIIREDFIFVWDQLEVVKKRDKTSEAITAHVGQGSIAVYNLHFVDVINFPDYKKSIGSDSKFPMTHF
jgi:hypothetical protein